MNTVISRLRVDAADIFRAGIDAADPFLAVSRSLNYSNQSLEIALNPDQPEAKRPGNWPRIHLIAFGKGACAMADAAQRIIPEQNLVTPGYAVTNYENERPIENVQVMAAAHPLPDAAGLLAAQKIAAVVQAAQFGELVLVLVSGGGSALLPYPAEGVSLQDKIATTDLLLASGATINQINCVRKHLSRLKGGGLARLAAPADLHALILSDVLGDDLSSIASGPTVPDDSRFADAAAILQNKGLWGKLPESVRNHLEKGSRGEIPETPKSDDPLFSTTSHTLVGSNRISVNAALKSAQQLGYQTRLYSDHVCGEAREEAERLAAFAKNVQATAIGPTAILAGGETTVTLIGSGRGGRNQEMALAFALAAERLTLKDNWVFLSGGTDGRDGPTDAAGGLVDPGTLSRIDDAAGFLNNNDSYSALNQSQDLLNTGATGTNVADLQVLLILPTS